MSSRRGGLARRERRPACTLPSVTAASRRLHPSIVYHYEFFAGGAPTWTVDPKARHAVFEDSKGVGWNVSVSYNAGLGRYLLATEHTASAQGRFGLFDAPAPWGPWTTVAYTESFGANQIEASTFFWNFSNRWTSDNGRRSTLVFTGLHSNDSWNVVGVRFTER